MLVIVSDLHLADNTLAPTAGEGAFRLFRDRLCDMAYDASWRIGDVYHPIEKITIVLLGDILDVIRSTRWQDVSVRPWDYDRRRDNRELFDIVSNITRDVLQCNSASIERLRSLGDSTELDMTRKVTVPRAIDAEPAGDPRDPDSPFRQTVPVEIFYMVGNHDWFYAIPSEEMDAVRGEIVGALGLAQDASAFPYIAGENNALQQALRQHGVHARHGDHLDPLNRFAAGDRLGASLGDAIVIDLMARFISIVHREKKVNPRLREQLCEIDNVRPLEALPLWLDGLLKHRASEGEESMLRTLWNRVLREFFRIPFIKQRDSWNPCETIDWMQLAFRLGNASPLSLAGGLARQAGPLLARLEAIRADPFAGAALAEAGEDPEIQYVAYGHTHAPLLVPLDIRRDENTEVRRLYFNTGTWRNSWAQTLRAPESGDFIPYHLLTILAFYHGDERKGRRFEMWNGSLDL